MDVIKCDEFLSVGLVSCLAMLFSAIDTAFACMFKLCKRRQIHWNQLIGCIYSVIWVAT